MGLYRLYPPVELQKGDLIVFEIPKEAEIMFQRGYVKNIDTLMKKVAAFSGDEIRIENNEVIIGSKNWGKIYYRDNLNRELKKLGKEQMRPSENEILVLSDVDKSFDGRYYGPIPIKSIKNKAKPVFIFKN